MTEPLFQLPFDQFQRYRLLADIIPILECDDRLNSILEVGGWPPRLHHFLPGRRVTVVDQVEAEAPGYVRASGLSLPFPDGSYDLAVSVDALEHVRPEDRRKFLSELCRVARCHVIVAAPFASEAVRAADRAVYEFILRQSGYEHQFLKEHLELELPDQVSTMVGMVECGLDVQEVPCGRLDHWMLMMTVYYTLDADPELQPTIPFFMEAYNRAFFDFDKAEPAYRHFLIGTYERLGCRWGALNELVSGEPGPDRDDRALAMVLEFARMTALRARDRELAGLRAELAAREAELAAARDENAQLHEFRRKVKSLPLYNFYEQFIKRRK